MRVWITKQALTKGIFEVDAMVSATSGLVSYKEKGYTQYIHKPFWHATREVALAHAEELRLKRVKSLEKSLDKMNTLIIKG